MTLNQDFELVSESEHEQTVEQQQHERLVSAAQFRLDKYAAEIAAQTQKRPIRWVKKYSIGVNNRNVEDDAKRVLDGFKRDIETGLYAILGTSQLGEHEEQRTIEFVHHHAVMCIDVRLWRFNFSDETKGGELNSVLCYVFCKSVLDRKSLTPTQLAYLLSEHAGDKNIESYIDKLIAVWSKMDGMPENVLSPNEAQVKALEDSELGKNQD
ncbi:hypothetical protein RhiJN_21624 [Ceratobasidium sp. AG-Ba]|nr:hypothetical protein RhiJN_21624 [Ceratobasidium sp. AG-Ba]